MYLKLSDKEKKKLKEFPSASTKSVGPKVNSFRLNSCRSSSGIEPKCSLVSSKSSPSPKATPAWKVVGIATNNANIPKGEERLKKRQKVATPTKYSIPSLNKSLAADATSKIIMPCNREECQTSKETLFPAISRSKSDITLKTTSLNESFADDCLNSSATTSSAANANMPLTSEGSCQNERIPPMPTQKSSMPKAQTEVITKSGLSNNVTSTGASSSSRKNNITRSHLTNTCARAATNVRASKNRQIDFQDFYDYIKNVNVFEDIHTAVDESKDQAIQNIEVLIKNAINATVATTAKHFQLITSGGDKLRNNKKKITRNIGIELNAQVADCIKALHNSIEERAKTQLAEKLKLEQEKTSAMQTIEEGCDRLLQANAELLTRLYKEQENSRLQKLEHDEKLKEILRENDDVTSSNINDKLLWEDKREQLKLTIAELEENLRENTKELEHLQDKSDDDKVIWQKRMQEAAIKMKNLEENLKNMSKENLRLSVKNFKAKLKLLRIMKKYKGKMTILENAKNQLSFQNQNQTKAYLHNKVLWEKRLTEAQLKMKQYEEKLEELAKKKEQFVEEFKNAQQQLVDTLEEMKKINDTLRNRYRIDKRAWKNVMKMNKSKLSNYKQRLTRIMEEHANIKLIGRNLKLNWKKSIEEINCKFAAGMEEAAREKQSIIAEYEERLKEFAIINEKLTMCKSEDDKCWQENMHEFKQKLAQYEDKLRDIEILNENLTKSNLEVKMTLKEIKNKIKLKMEECENISKTKLQDKLMFENNVAELKAKMSEGEHKLKEIYMINQDLMEDKLKWEKSMAEYEQKLSDSYMINENMHESTVEDKLQWENRMAECKYKMTEYEHRFRKLLMINGNLKESKLEEKLIFEKSLKEYKQKLAECMEELKVMSTQNAELLANSNTQKLAWGKCSEELKQKIFACENKIKMLLTENHNLAISFASEKNKWNESAKESKEKWERLLQKNETSLKEKELLEQNVDELGYRLHESVKFNKELGKDNTRLKRSYMEKRKTLENEIIALKMQINVMENNYQSLFEYNKELNCKRFKDKAELKELKENMCELKGVYETICRENDYLKDVHISKTKPLIKSLQEMDLQMAKGEQKQLQRIQNVTETQLQKVYQDFDESTTRLSEERLANNQLTMEMTAIKKRIADLTQNFEKASKDLALEKKRVLSLNAQYQKQALKISSQKQAVNENERLKLKLKEYKDTALQAEESASKMDKELQSKIENLKKKKEIKEMKICMLSQNFHEAKEKIAQLMSEEAALKEANVQVKLIMSQQQDEIKILTEKLKKINDGATSTAAYNESYDKEFNRVMDELCAMHVREDNFKVLTENLDKSIVLYQSTIMKKSKTINDLKILLYQLKPNAIKEKKSTDTIRVHIDNISSFFADAWPDELSD